MKITHSIFTKLFIIMIVAGVAVNLLVGVFFRHYFTPGNKVFYLNNIRQYSDYIVKEIGSPPDTKRAAEIAKQTGIYISIKGKGVSWSSTGHLPPDGKSREIHRMGDGSIAWERGRFLYKKEYRAYRYIFSTMSQSPTEGRDLHLVLLITVLSFILIACFLLIRKILMPVRRLTSGMREVSDGNLGYKVEVYTKDELGELTRSFNEMRERIGLMLRSREQLLLDVSHELRSPLTRIKVALEYLKDSKTRRNIADDIQEMEIMVAEILETERFDRNGGKLQMEETGLLGIVREVVDGLHCKPGEVIIHPAGDPIVLADRDLMKTVFRNIIENARKYSKAGGDPVTVTLRKQAETVCAEVRDSGIGIPEKDLPFVFEPFYRVDHSRSRKTGGYGLGLSMCKKIVEAHDGTIGIESTPGEGTTVRITLKKPDSNR
jgi:signal transduction histidine kinase